MRNIAIDRDGVKRETNHPCGHGSGQRGCRWCDIMVAMTPAPISAAGSYKALRLPRIKRTLFFAAHVLRGFERTAGSRAKLRFATDSKSSARKGVWGQVPPAALLPGRLSCSRIARPICRRGESHSALNKAMLMCRSAIVRPASHSPTRKLPPATPNLTPTARIWRSQLPPVSSGAASPIAASRPEIARPRGALDRRKALEL
jgi:hypothetical protein